MNCKYCGAPLEDEQSSCPVCGADQTAQEAPVTEEEIPGAQEEPAEDLGEDAALDEAQSETADPQPAPKKPGKGLLIGLSLLALAAIAALVLTFTGVLGGEKKAVGDPTDVAMLDEAGAFVAHDFTKANDQITAEEAAAVIATAGKLQLTNAELGYYYWQQYYNLYSTYGAYISYILDPAKSLAEQMVDDTHSWQDQLVQASLTAFRQNSALSAAAEKAGFRLDEQYEQYLTSMQENMDADAKTNGYESGDDYLKSFYGPYATSESYLTYARTTFVASSYMQTLFDAITYEPADVEKYFDENPEEFAEKNVKKDDPNLVNVRHILIAPTADEGAETDENGKPVLTDANWAAAKAQADEVYAKWQAGEQTQEAFAALATENTTDPGSKETGGLYENVYPGQMMPEFGDWCFDAARKTGDTGIVKTDYGYHIMYFVATGEHPQWYSLAETALMQSLQKKTLEDLTAKDHFKADASKIVLGESDLTKQGQ